MYHIIASQSTVYDTIPESCKCGKKPIILNNISDNTIVAKCGIVKHKLLSIKSLKSEPTGKTPCDFKFIIKLNNNDSPEITIPDIGTMNIHSKLKKNLKNMLNGYIEDRNIFLYYIKLFKEKEKDDPHFIKQCYLKLEETDAELLESIKRKILQLKKFPDYEIINNLMWIVKEFINKDTFYWKLETPKDIVQFYTDIREIYLNTKKVGFTYRPPYPRQITNPAPTIVKKIKRTIIVEKDHLLIPLVHPNNMENVQSNNFAKKEFSDDEYSVADSVDETDSVIYSDDERDNVETETDNLYIGEDDEDDEEGVPIVPVNNQTSNDDDDDDDDNNSEFSD